MSESKILRSLPALLHLWLKKHTPTTGWKKLTYRTRYREGNNADFVPLDKDAKNLQSGIYHVGYIVTRESDGRIIIETRTVEFKEEKMNSISHFTKEGTFDSETVNMFAFGIHTFNDAEYTIQLFRETLDKNYAPIKWDVIM